MNNYKIKSLNNKATALGIVAVAFTTSINETLPFFLLPKLAVLFHVQ
jgi:hypothetical protein